MPISALRAVLTAPEAAKHHHLSHWYIVRLVSQGTVLGRKAGGTWLIDAASLRAYLSKERKPGPKPRQKSS